MNGSKIKEILKLILDYNISNNFEGYDKFDGANNIFSEKIFKKSKLIRFLFQQIIKESPVNLRNLLLIEKKQNIKGNGLFVNALVKYFNITKDEYYLNEAKRLLKKQITLASKNFDTLAWGHNFTWQGLNFTLPKYYPNITNTIITAEAILELYKTTKEGEFLEYLESVKDSIFNVFPQVFEEEDKLAISYFPFKSYPICINIQAFTSAFLIKYHLIDNDKKTKEFSDKLMNFVIYSMNEEFSWYYSCPKSDHPLKKDLPDNYHTAFILDSLLDYYKITKNEKILKIYTKSLEFYQNNLFTIENAPKWTTESKYPYDIHGAANSIITFSKASEIDKKYRDNAKTCHYKNTLSMMKILKDNLNNILLRQFKPQKQMAIQPSYYPKRTAEDGLIFWNRSTKEIYNLIRAVTKPFPGAFTFLNDKKIEIWEAQPFDTRLFDPYIFPGTILHVFDNGDFIVKTGTDSLLVTNYEGIKKDDLLKYNILTQNNCFEYTNPFNYPANL